MWTVIAGFKSFNTQLGAQMLVDSSQMKRRTFQAVLSVALAILIHLVGCNNFFLKTERHFVSKHYLIITIIAAFILYCVDIWLPVTHTILSLIFSLIVDAPGAQNYIRTATVSTPLMELQPSPSTNVIFIMGESLSGSHALNVQGRKAMPFFQSLLANKPEMYVFPKARSVSGNTVDCLTSLASGCLPYTKAGEEIAFSQSIGSEFKSMGYQTVSFSSRELSSLKGTRWNMLHSYLTTNFDQVYDPTSEGYKIVNAEGCDDRKLVSDFEGWMKKRSINDTISTKSATKSNSNTPFYAQFYMFNTHWPYFCPSCPKVKRKHNF